VFDEYDEDEWMLADAWVLSSILNAVIGLHVLTGRPSGVSPESWRHRPRSEGVVSATGHA